MVEEKKVLTEISLMNDAAFKALFRSKDARGIVSTFLSEVTGISKEQFMNGIYVGGELTKQIITEKGKTADVLIILNDKQFVIVEANTSQTKTLFKKNLSYATSVYTEAIKRGKNIYPEVILVNVNCFNNHHTNNDVIHYQIQDEKCHHYLEDAIVIYDIVLENLLKPRYNNIVLKKFETFLTTTNLKDLKSLSRGDKEYMKAFKKVEDLARDEEFIGYYDYEEARKWEYASLRAEMKEEGLEEGRNEGRIEGRIETQKILLKNMMESGMEISDIARVTKLSEASIQELL